MAIDFQKLHDAFLANMTAGMYEWLGHDLSVSPASLKAIEVGWAPVVHFKKNVGYGWFTVPMRDETASITGLALRGCVEQGHADGDGKDIKVLYPGSKPGCFYAVNPDHRLGDRGYSAGPHNWRRSSVDQRCPVCDKPDGCLIARNDAAAICRATSSGKPMKFGWLHILKPEGNISTASPLPAGTVFTVEGMSDVCALYDLGFVSVGRPSNTGGLSIVADLVRGRDVVVLGENDKKADGRYPGKEGALSALQTCKRTARTTRMVMPPDTIKDVRAWKINNGLTAEALLAYVEQSDSEAYNILSLPDDIPLTIARAFLRDVFNLGKHSILRRWDGAWYAYDAALAKYVLKQDEAVAKALYVWSEDKRYPIEGKEGVHPLRVTTGVLSNVSQAALADTLVDERSIPVWINDVRGPDPKDLIVFNNGILDVPGFLDGREDYMLETTPDFFATTALPIAFNPVAECPEWLKFVNSSLGDDEGKITLLQEWLGYCMTPDMTQHKLMYLWGVPGSGKSRVMEVLQALVGAEQSVTTSFADITGPFGLHPLVGKLACLIWDIRVSNNAEAMKGLEVLLNISGDDGVQVNRKNVDALATMRLTTRITMASNALLNVPDIAGASLRRLNIIRFNRSFASNPDTHLFEKLRNEIAGIANWALVGLRRLRLNGKFTVPASSEHAIEEWRIATNPVASFIMECTDIDVEAYETRREMYDAWAKWSELKRQIRISKSEFYSAMASIAPQARLTTLTVNRGDMIGKNEQVYAGIRLTPEAGRQFLGRP